MLALALARRRARRDGLRGAVRARLGRALRLPGRGPRSRRRAGGAHGAARADRRSRPRRRRAPRRAGSGRPARRRPVGRLDPGGGRRGRADPAERARGRGRARGHRRRPGRRVARQRHRGGRAGAAPFAGRALPRARQLARRRHSRDARAGAARRASPSAPARSPPGCGARSTRSRRGSKACRPGRSSWTRDCSSRFRRTASWPTWSAHAGGELLGTEAAGTPIEPCDLIRLDPDVVLTYDEAPEIQTYDFPKCLDAGIPEGADIDGDLVTQAGPERRRGARAGGAYSPPGCLRVGRPGESRRARSTAASGRTRPASRSRPRSSPPRPTPSGTRPSSAGS